MTRHRRRGAAYMLVMMCVVLLTVIALSGLYGARVQERAAAGAGAMEQARLNARSAVELGAHVLQTTPNWRTSLGGTFFTDRPFGQGDLTVTVRDPSDGVVANSNLDPIIMRGVGTHAEARQMVEVRLEAIPTALDSLQSSAHAGRRVTFDGARVEADAVLTSNVDMVAIGADVRTDVASAGAITGTQYKAATRPGAPERQMPIASEVINEYAARATTVTIADIARVSSNILENGSFDHGTTPWSITGGTLSLSGSGSQVGPRHVRVSSRTAYDVGPTQDVTARIQNAQSYEVGAWVRAGSLMDARVEIRIVETDAEVTLVGTLLQSVGSGWAFVSGTVTPTWDVGELSTAHITINTAPGQTGDFEVDGASMRPVTPTPPVIEEVVLSPQSNPYGAGTLNSEGIYLIDCANEPLTIRNCRIQGTLVLLRALGGVTIEGSVVWEPAALAPSLIAEGDLVIATTQDDLREDDYPANFNPPGTPWQGAEDTDAADAYASVLGGIFYATRDVRTAQRPSFNGVLIAGRDITFTGEFMITHRPVYSSTPPPGFLGPERMVVVPRTWTKVVD